MVKRFARLLLVAAVLLAVAGTAGFGFGAPGYTLKLDFTNSDGVVKGADVTIAGVNAGKVESLGVKDKVGVVGGSIDSKFAPLHGGAKAIVRSVGLLGHKYVEIIDGKGRRALRRGGRRRIHHHHSP